LGKFYMKSKRLQTGSQIGSVSFPANSDSNSFKLQVKDRMEGSVLHVNILALLSWCVQVSVHFASFPAD
jgi:hypothetical protein